MIRTGWSDLFWQKSLRFCTSAAWLGLLAAGTALDAGAQGVAPARFDARALMRRAVQHRLDEDKDHRPLRYVLRKQDEQRETKKMIIETKDGDVARLIEVDGKPLSAEAEHVEMARLDTLAAHPEMEERRRRNEIRDQARVDYMMAMLPDSERYTFEGMAPCDAGRCYRLSFVPNPRFEPPDLEADILRGVAGEVWIDQVQERLVRLDARFVADVDFGFGILGKVNKGGTVQLQQADVGGGEWEVTGMKVYLTGKALLVKSVRVQIEEDASGFVPVPRGLSYRDGIAMLKPMAK
jgi:hypothetical protein